MSKINWIRVLSSNNIEFVERGPNVQKGHVNIKCPFCGSSDPSHHMGLELSTGYWGCWRNKSHRGKSPIRLLVKLLRCSFQRAFDIAGIKNSDYIDPDGFDSVAARLLNKVGYVERVEEIRRDFLKYPAEFREITDSYQMSMFYDYLIRRKFGVYDIESLCDQYRLRGALTGEFSRRLIIPYIVNDELVSWTGRTISSLQNLRYKDLSVEESLIAPKSTLFNHDAGYDKRGRVLVVVEGPIDALKLDFYGRDWGVRAVALSTNSITDEQTFLLDDMSRSFKKVVIMLDSQKSLDVVSSIRMRSSLSQIKNLTYMEVPFDKKDFGELNAQQATTFCRTIEE